MKTNKLKLSNLTVKSIITELHKNETLTVKGGGSITTTNSSIPVQVTELCPVTLPI